MINYKILRVDRTSQFMTVQYSSDDSSEPDFFTRISISADDSAGLLATVAENTAEQASEYWANLLSDLTLSESQSTGTAKRTVFEAQPNYDAETQYLTRTTSETSTTITKGWAINALDSDMLAANVRGKRSNLLQDTDEYALSDRTLDSDMRVYRQALRDIPQQDGFPNTIVWPTKPE